MTPKAVLMEIAIKYDGWRKSALRNAAADRARGDEAEARFQEGAGARV